MWPEQLTGSYQIMELQGENGNVTIPVHEGEVKVLGRSSLPMDSDRTVSEKQVILQMVQCTGPERCRISVEVVGQNPICIYRAGDKPEMKNSVDTKVDFLNKGEKSWLAPGDKLSLSISQPHFLTVQEAPVGGESVEHPTDLIQHLEEQQEQLPCNDNDDTSTRLERRPEAATGGERRASGQGTIASSHRPAIEPEPPADADLATEFGLVVEGSEFDPYERKMASTSREWTWRIGKKAAEKNSDDEEEEEQEEWKPTPSTKAGASAGGGRGKRKAVEFEEGEEEEGRKRQSRGEHGPEAAAGRVAESPSSTRPGRSSCRTRGESGVGAGVDADLEGFIVEDEEEAEADDDEEEEEEWEEEGDDEEEEEEEEEDDTWLDEEEVGACSGRGSGPAPGTRRSEQKPMCKYGSTCFRKNPQHLAEFRHGPS